MGDFRELPMWKKSFKLANDVYDLTESFPKEERYALTDQLRRAVLSISANISESYGRFHKGEKVNFLYYARGSTYEVLNFLLFAKARNYINDTTFEQLELSLNSIISGLYINIKLIQDR